MQNSSEKSSIRLVSNIMLKSKYEKDTWGYLPPDLLPDYYSDSRAQSGLTVRQREQYTKKLYYAKEIVDEL